jgi:hypothetical protein
MVFTMKVVYGWQAVKAGQIPVDLPVKFRWICRSNSGGFAGQIPVDRAKLCTETSDNRHFTFFRVYNAKSCNTRHLIPELFSTLFREHSAPYSCDIRQVLHDFQEWGAKCTGIEVSDA